MYAKRSVLDELRGLLGDTAADERVWRELRRFELEALAAVHARWRLEDHEGHGLWQLLGHGDMAARAAHERRVEDAAGEAVANLGGDAPACAASFMLHPQLWAPQQSGARHDWQARHRQQVRAQLLAEVAAACLRRAAPPDWPRRLAQRAVAVCSARAAGDEEPGLGWCVAQLAERDAGGAFLDALTLGDWPAAWARLTQLAGSAGDAGPEGLRARWQSEGAAHAVALIGRMWRGGGLDARRFGQALAALPGALQMVNLAVEGGQGEVEPALRAELRRLTDAALWELLADFRPEGWPALCSVGRLSGGRVLLRLAEEVGRLAPGALARRGARAEHAGSVVAHLLGVLVRREDDDSPALTSLLSSLAPETLLALLPLARGYESELCAALGWAGAAPLVAMLHQVEAADPADGAEPGCGVLARSDALAACAALEGPQLAALLDAYAAVTPGACFLVRAALGLNRAEVRRKLGRRSRIAARAIGLLPLEQPGEALQRYLMLRRFEREAGGRGAWRRYAERAAARDGLVNLAATAGYRDATRLEWAMEDCLGAQETQIGRSWAIEGYTITLALREDGPALAVHSARRELKRTPPAVTRDYAYREVREALEQAREQDRRYRQAFLEAMRAGAALSAEELELLSRNPLAASQLERLVLIDEAGAVGLFRAADLALEGARGELMRISGAARIAHPITLAAHGLLDDWQAEAVRRRLAQPFRQIFREMYLLTPAERAAGDRSLRLAGRRMASRQAMAVLSNMGWIVDGYGEARRPLHGLGVEARFETGAWFDYGAPEAAASTGALEFWPAERQAGQARRVPLADIPPLALSEIMRDLDLVTAIAHQSDEGGASREALRRRGDLVRATAAALGMAQVQVEEPYAHVRGALTSYRVHLATAAIYLESGQYLCIVPSPKERQAIYLPFEDSSDPICSELVSKVLLLANDTAIADTTILAQIRPVRQAA